MEQIKNKVKRAAILLAVPLGAFTIGLHSWDIYMFFWGNEVRQEISNLQSHVPKITLYQIGIPLERTLQYSAKSANFVYGMHSYNLYLNAEDTRNYYHNQFIEAGWTYVGVKDNYMNGSTIGESFQYSKGEYNLSLAFRPSIKAVNSYSSHSTHPYYLISIEHKR